MKKFGLNNKNPNPPWPSEQPVVVIPPGSSPSSVGLDGEPLRRADTYDIFPDTRNMSDSVSAAAPGNADTDFSAYESDRTIREYTSAEYTERQTPLMGDDFRPSEQSLTPRTSEVSLCAFGGGISEYLCSRGEVSVSVEFIGDRQPGIKRVGILSGIGSDFIALRDRTNGNTVVCPAGSIKTIDIIEK